MGSALKNVVNMKMLNLKSIFIHLNPIINFYSGLNPVASSGSKTYDHSHFSVLISEALHPTDKVGASGNLVSNI